MHVGCYPYIIFLNLVQNLSRSASTFDISVGVIVVLQRSLEANTKCLQHSNSSFGKRSYRQNREE